MLDINEVYEYCDKNILRYMNAVLSCSSQGLYSAAGTACWQAVTLVGVASNFGAISIVDESVMRAMLGDCSDHLIKEMFS